MSGDQSSTSGDVRRSLTEWGFSRVEARDRVEAAWPWLTKPNPLRDATGLPAGTDIISVREQTEHLYIIEKELAGRGVPADLIRLGFLILHRQRPMPFGVWCDDCAVAYAAVLDVDRRADAL
ncbi:hypothetical protein SAMN05428985_11529 [Nocardioides sp. YR527]|uniref:hypothetical protein n=1 Tax=Nocardioides sp. YR527 TaxID=1881028 RepID=UPI0008896661|nr:hypothetical protein [Nocardioides sp. YR527]SDL34059.1 hypothetical protein SAMN05428985_11529 [Nocardioides sp. YR527]